jgi:hypothetical protein
LQSTRSPDDLLLWSADENWPYRKEGPVARHRQTFRFLRFLVITNSIENFWALLKRTLKGTYVAVELVHLDDYVTEPVFRYNNRATKDNPLKEADHFALIMSQIRGKRITDHICRSHRQGRAKALLRSVRGVGSGRNRPLPILWGFGSYHSSHDHRELLKTSSGIHR